MPLVLDEGTNIDSGQYLRLSSFEQNKKAVKSGLWPGASL